MQHINLVSTYAIFLLVCLRKYNKNITCIFGQNTIQNKYITLSTGWSIICSSTPARSIHGITS